MRIECKLFRKGGTKVDIGGVTYHFKPISDSEDAPHVAEVEDEDHIARFISINEAYRMFKEGRPAARVEAQQPKAEPQGLAGGAPKKPALTPPDTSLSKAQIVAWINANMPSLDYNPKLNKDAILKAIDDALKG